MCTPKERANSRSALGGQSSREDTARNLRTDTRTNATIRVDAGTPVNTATGRRVTSTMSATPLTSRYPSDAELQALGYTTNNKLNFNDKGPDGKVSSHLVTYDEDLSRLAGKLVLGKKYVRPRTSLLSDRQRDELNRPNIHGRGGASHGDRSNSMSGR